jgi:hypothetical protein
MTPDFPSAAQAVLTLYGHTRGQRLDGVIIADPLALQALAEANGEPVEIPGLGPVQPEEFAETVANEAFGEFEDHDLRKRVLGAAAAEVLTAFLDGGGVPADGLRTLGSVATNGNLLLHATDPAVQAELVRAGLAGELPPATTDYVNVVAVNGAGNKVDFYTDRTVTYAVVLEAEGQARATTGVTLTNHAPAQGPSQHVIGPNFYDLAAGENATILNVFCGRCEVQRMERNGETAVIRAEQELGHRVFWSYERLLPREAVTTVYQWVVPKAWSRGRHLGRYRLVVDGQATLRPTRFDLSITLPGGTAVVSSSPGLSATGERLRFEGELSGRRTFEVIFRSPGNPVTTALSEWWRRPLFGEYSRP